MNLLPIHNQPLPNIGLNAVPDVRVQFNPNEAENNIKKLLPGKHNKAILYRNQGQQDDFKSVSTENGKGIVIQSSQVSEVFLRQ